MRLWKAILIGGLVFGSCPIAAAQNINQLIAFGDSTIDTGWFAHASTGFPNLDFWIANSLAAGGNAHWTGPGPGNAQILAGVFGATANPANEPGGTNYAVGGALDNRDPDGLVDPRRLSSNPAVPSTAKQIGNYLSAANGVANPNALYLIGSGGNDVFVAFQFYGANAQAANAYLLGEAKVLASGITQLQSAGARYIIVTDLYQPPFVTTATKSAYLKTILSATWSDLAAAGVNFVPADTASVIAAVEKNPSAFGITAPLTSYACVPPAGRSPNDLGWGATCAPTTIPNPNYGYLVSANALQTHLFMDGSHLTEAGQIIEADYIYSLLAAPSEMSFLAESAIQTTFGMIYGIEQQIDVAQRRGPAGWNVWANGDLQYLQISNNSAGLPNDPGIPISGSLGVDYRWANGWLFGAAITGSFLNSTFSTGGGFTQNEGALSIYAAFRNTEWWANLIGSVGLLAYTTNRPVPIGITEQPNNGSTLGSELALAAEGGYEFHTGPIAHGPVAGLILQQARIAGFTESGSFTSLSFAAQLRNSEVSLAGYQANFDAGIWHPFFQALWDHEFDPLNRVVTASLTTIAAPSYFLPAAATGRDWATVIVGTEIRFSQSWSGLASLTAQLGEANVNSYGGLLGLNYSFGAEPTAPILYKN